MGVSKCFSVLWLSGAACALSSHPPQNTGTPAVRQVVVDVPAASDIAYVSREVRAGFIAPGSPGEPVLVDGIQTTMFHDEFGFPKAYSAADGTPLIMYASSVFTWNSGELRAAFIPGPYAKVPRANSLNLATVVPVPGGGQLLAMHMAYVDNSCCTLADWPAGAREPRAVSPGQVELLGVHRGAPLVLDRERRMHRLLGKGKFQTLTTALPIGLRVTSLDAVRDDRLLVHGEHGGYVGETPAAFRETWRTHVFTLDLVTGAIVHLAEIEGRHLKPDFKAAPEPYIYVAWSNHDRHVGMGRNGVTTFIDVDTLKPTSPP